MAIEVEVRNNDVEQAMRRLKKLMNREGILQEVRDRRYHVKPAEKRLVEKRESKKRVRRAERKRINSL